MAQFLNPFPGLKPDHTPNKEELSRAIRQAISSEQEAVHQYEAIADATDDEHIKATLIDIANEERVHIGELQQLLEVMLPDEAELIEKGKKEASEIEGIAKETDENL